MRIMVFFDLPVTTEEHRRSYRKFRKLLEQEGFVMMQESVYCKITLNATMTDLVKNKLRHGKPQDGLVQILTVTEKQFASIENLVGGNKYSAVNNDARFVVL